MDFSDEYKDFDKKVTKIEEALKEHKNFLINVLEEVELIVTTKFPDETERELSEYRLLKLITTVRRHAGIFKLLTMGGDYK